MNGVRRILALLLVAGAPALAGCWSKDTAVAVQANVMPTEYRKEVLDLIPKLVEDPTNIRDAGISEPRLEQMPGGDARYTICVHFNPRNANHEYLGVVERVGYFFNGKLTQFVKAEPGQCKSVVYGPFPELEKICLGKSCN